MASLMLSDTKQTTQVNDDDGDSANSCTGSIWSNAVKWITSNGGFVHPQLSYNESQRQVYFDPSSCVGVVDAGTTLLRIPDACLPSLHSVENDEEFGKSLFGVVHSLEASLYHDAQDVVLALFLARQQQRKQHSPSFYEPYLATLPVAPKWEELGQNIIDTAVEDETYQFSFLMKLVNVDSVNFRIRG
eukprot:scaffold4016_cov116-Skeletonema_menzelii.AAC.4